MWEVHVPGPPPPVSLRFASRDLKGKCSSQEPGLQNGMLPEAASLPAVPHTCVHPPDCQVFLFVATPHCLTYCTSRNLEIRLLLLQFCSVFIKNLWYMKLHVLMECHVIFRYNGYTQSPVIVWRVTEYIYSICRQPTVWNQTPNCLLCVTICSVHESALSRSPSPAPGNHHYTVGSHHYTVNFREMTLLSLHMVRSVILSLCFNYYKNDHLFKKLDPFHFRKCFELVSVSETLDDNFIEMTLTAKVSWDALNDSSLFQAMSVASLPRCSG